MPFFPRILIHLVGLGDIVRKRGWWRREHGMLLQAMPQLQQHAAITIQLTSQARRGGALGNPTQNEDDLTGSAVRVVESSLRPGVEDASAIATLVIEDRSAVAAMNIQTIRCATARTSQTTRMEDVHQEVITGGFIHEIDKGKVHDSPSWVKRILRDNRAHSTPKPRKIKGQFHRTAIMSQHLFRALQSVALWTFPTKTAVA
jgi:hypothetical protein